MSTVASRSALGEYVAKIPPMKSGGGKRSDRYESYEILTSICYMHDTGMIWKILEIGLISFRFWSS